MRPEGNDPLRIERGTKEENEPCWLRYNQKKDCGRQIRSMRGKEREETDTPCPGRKKVPPVLPGTLKDIYQRECTTWRGD
jgi:hypothetical protein